MQRLGDVERLFAPVARDQREVEVISDCHHQTQREAVATACVSYRHRATVTRYASAWLSAVALIVQMRAHEGRGQASAFTSGSAPNQGQQTGTPLYRPAIGVVMGAFAQEEQLIFAMPVI